MCGKSHGIEMRGLFWIIRAVGLVGYLSLFPESLCVDFSHKVREPRRSLEHDI
jgi:hypothetical protein